ncbi:hypothetical protein GPJ59_01785, partial [Streptomyces bambusae]|nr:hypothetical protein [Streptomyces bambusae]
SRWRRAQPAQAPDPARQPALDGDRQSPSKGHGHGHAEGPLPVPDIPEPQAPGARPDDRPGHGQKHGRPDAGMPRQLVEQLPMHPADVCAMGRRHGRWSPDSPEARICAGVHEG